MQLTYAGKVIDVKPVDLNQIVELEEKFGSITKLNNGEPVPVKLVRYLGYILIRKEMPEVTEEEVGSNLDMGAIASIISSLNPAPRVGDERPLP